MMFAIKFYRILGITFDGLSLDKNGNIIKSKFWYYFSWLGFVIYTIPILFFILSFGYNLFIKMGLTMYLLVNGLWYFTSFTRIFSILIIYHKYGFKIIMLFMKHSLTEYTKLKYIKILWISHLVIFPLTFFIQSSFFLDSRHTIISLITNLMMMPLYYSLSFVSWMVSISFSENIKIIRKYLISNNSFAKFNYLNTVTKFMVINYKIINKIDNFLAFGFITSAIEIVLSIMSSVYLALFASKFNFIKDILAFTLVFHFQELFQLILHCFFNAKVNEESIKLLNDLDNININVNDDQLLKSLILLKTSINKTKTVFTIGGFPPWNKLTLLQVTLN